MVLEKLTFTLIQSDLTPKKDGNNLQYFSELIHSIEEKTDFIILPELFTRGYSLNIRSLAENMDGPSVEWMLNIAREKRANVIGSLVINENEHYYNRLIWVQSDGTIHHYDKRHLFRMTDEHKILDDGKNKIIVNFQGWKICPLICYDLRFPVWSRKKSRDEFDILIYVANWPESRTYHWRSLLIARAIENQSYVIGVNRTGIDAYGIPFRGDSMIIDPRGEVLSDLKDGEHLLTKTISKTVIKEYRSEFPTWQDADNFQILRT